MTDCPSWTRLPLTLLPLVLAVLAPVTADAQRPAASTDTLVVLGVGNATAQLGGKWQFKTGDDMAWAAPEFDDSGWEKIGVDNPWGAQTHFGYTGYGWYRRRIDFAPVAGADPDLALEMPTVEDAYELYWNGRLVGKVGKLPPNADFYYHDSPHLFGLGKAGSGVLAVRIWKAPYSSFDSGATGGLNGPPLVGSVAAITAHKAERDYHWLKSRQYNFGLCLLYLLVALLGLLAWGKSRNQRVLLWMAVFALCPLLFLGFLGLRLPIPYYLGLGLLQPVFSLQDISLWFLLLYLLQLDDRPRLMRWTTLVTWISLTATCMDGLLTAFDWSGPHVHLFQAADGILTAVFTVLQLYPLVIVPFALGKRLDAARWLVASFALLTEMIAVLRIALQQGQRFTHWTLADKIDAPLFVINTNPFTMTTLTSTLLFISVVYAVYRYSAEQSKRQGALEQEFKSAQEVQRILIPETLPPLPGYAVTSAYRPAQEVGGDFFQLIPLEPLDGTPATLLILGDVSGKGLKAAMTVSLLVGAVRTLAETSSDPAAILAGMNRRLEGRLQNGFVTCLVLRLEPDGACAIANAGHLSPFLNDRELEFPGELPLGVVPDTVFETTRVQLGVGDRLTLYTDGLLEARSRSGELYGFERVRALFATQPDAQTASEAAVTFGQDDDITVLTVTRLAVGVASTTRLVAPELVATA
jgi:hypothetical protein